MWMTPPGIMQWKAWGFETRLTQEVRLPSLLGALVIRKDTDMDNLPRKQNKVLSPTQSHPKLFLLEKDLSRYANALDRTSISLNLTLN